MKTGAHLEGHEVFHSNGVKLGEVGSLVDGYYYFFPDLTRGGAWDENTIREIADILHILNNEWDKGIKEYMATDTSHFEQAYRESMDATCSREGV